MNKYHSHISPNQTFRSQKVESNIEHENGDNNKSESSHNSHRHHHHHKHQTISPCRSTHKNYPPPPQKSDDKNPTLAFVPYPVMYPVFLPMPYPVPVRAVHLRRRRRRKSVEPEKEETPPPEEEKKEKTPPPEEEEKKEETPPPESPTPHVHGDGKSSNCKYCRFYAQFCDHVEFTKTQREKQRLRAEGKLPKKSTSAEGGGNSEAHAGSRGVYWPSPSSTSNEKSATFFSSPSSSSATSTEKPAAFFSSSSSSSSFFSSSVSASSSSPLDT